MAIGQSNKPNFNVQAPVANQSLVFDTNQQAFVNANISSTGSITGASNVGAGQGNVFKQLSGTDLQFKTLTQGNNVTIADGTDSITISANGVVTTAENLGSGTGLFAQLNSGTGKVQFKGLVAGTGIALANNSTDVTVSIDASTVDAATLGGNAASVFLTKADNLASVGSLSTARDNLSVYSKAEGDARYYRQAADILPDADNTRSLGSNSNRFSDIYAVDIHGTVTTAGQVTSLANQDIGNLRDVDTTGVASNSILKWNGTKWAIAVDAGGITTLNALTDVDTTGAVNSSVLKYNASSGQWEVGSDVSGGGGGASTFVGLTDTPNNFVGAGSKFVKVNSGGNALEFTTVDTDGIAEGTNLYFTNARADARIGAANISDLSDVHTAAPTDGQVLKWDNANSYWKPAADSTYTNFNTDFDNRLATKNTDNLTEGSSNLYFTNARWDARLGAKSTTDLTEGSNLYYTDARVNTRVNALGKANWDTAYGWGDHGAAGYQTAAGLNGAIDSHLNQSGPTSGYVLSWNGSDYAWVAQSSGGSVAGSNTQVQFNDGGSFGADSGLTFNKSTDTLTAGSFTTSGASPKLSSTAALTIESGSNNDITITPNGSGDIILDGQKWPQADGSAGQYLKTDGAGQLSWGSVTGGPADTDALSEGSTNLYFTNSRAISAVQGTSLNMGSNNITTTGKILYSNVYNNTGDLPSASTYHGMFAHVHGTGKGYFAHAGNWIPLANESALSSYQTTAGLNAAIDSHLNQSGPTSGYVLSWNGSDYVWVAQSGGGPADTDALSEGSSNLYFTNARADARITAAIKDEDNMASDSATHVPSQQSVKAYVDAQVATKDNTDEITEGSTNLYFTNARADARIGAADIADLNNVNNAAPTDGQVLTWDNANSYWKPATAGGGGGGTDVQRFKINYATNGQLSSITDKTSGISSVSIDSAAGGDITINFTGYSYPPASITLYGYNYPSNKYNVNPLNKDITLREIPGGGSSGSPTAFGSFASVKIKAAEADSGASRSFGTVTHAWVQVVMGG